MFERPRIERRWIMRYMRRGALWSHDGSPKRPHALISSNLHSDSYTNSELVMEDPTLLAEACRDLIKRLISSGLDLSDIDRVIGPEKGAIKISHDLARQINYRRTFKAHCLSGFAEKVDEGTEKRMVLSRFAIQAGERILGAEDVLTTGGTIELTALVAENAGGVVLPYIAVLVNSSRKAELNGRKIVSLFNRPIPMFPPENCLLCHLGSEAIRPKGIENWKRLNAKY